MFLGPPSVFAGRRLMHCRSIEADLHNEEDITRCGDCWLKLQGAHLGRLQQGPAVPQRMAGAPRQRTRSLPEPLPRLVHEAHLARQHRNALVQVRVGPPARGRDALNIRNTT